ISTTSGELASAYTPKVDVQGGWFIDGTQPYSEPVPRHSPLPKPWRTSGMMFSWYHWRLAPSNTRRV
ncbi:MAG: hypothetical protein M1415_03310, partial [Firmicutes bacterium]|nr:hypothetical protein [Bacillota bacterium]